MRKGIVVLLAAMVIVLSGCDAEIEKAETSPDNKSMFVQVENGTAYRVFYHKHTRVMYIMSDGSYNHGTFTVMLDADGKPLLYGN